MPWHAFTRSCIARSCDPSSGQQAKAACGRGLSQKACIPFPGVSTFTCAVVWSTSSEGTDQTQSKLQGCASSLEGIVTSVRVARQLDVLMGRSPRRMHD
ncbi:hypothetical protein WJX73_009219 [Symbiochloris irregularis]|uniref:Uncharacterized protein n=1 Tax=Symbiochloris irregularis TaxID=706552 RepID=A0AAW1NLN9_9CHLO